MNDWRSYDDVAETYERVHAPRFRDIARDLVAVAGFAEGARVLDVGTGTGLAAEAAAEAGARVVGIDPSLGMLAVARRERPKLVLVAAEAIDLPFAGGAFDAVVANLVLAHFTRYQTALFDIARVLRPGGRLAVSAWSDAPDAFIDAWTQLVESVVPRDVLAGAFAKAVPWHDRFRRPEPIEEAIAGAGLRGVRSEVRRYRWTYGREEFVDGLSTFATGRFVREMLGERGWESFRERARATFADRFPDPLNDFREVILAVGTRPAG